MHLIFARISGIILIIMGILGSFNNPVIGSTGIFHTGILDNTTHIILGIILLSSNKKIYLVLRYMGLFFIFFAIVGFLTPGDFIILNGLMNMNMALDIAGAVFGTILIGVSYINSQRVLK